MDLCTGTGRESEIEVGRDGHRGLAWRGALHRVDAGRRFLGQGENHGDVVRAVRPDDARLAGHIHLAYPLGRDGVERSLRFLGARFERSSFCVVYLPSPLASYDLAGASASVQALPMRPSAFASETIAASSDELAARVRRIALDGGRDGLTAYRKIIGDSRPYLSRAGKLILELDPELHDGITSIAQKNNYTVENVVKDLNSNDRVVVLSR